MPSSVAAACSSKSNDAAEALAQRQAPGAVDAPAERRVDARAACRPPRRRSARRRRVSCVGTRAERRAPGRDVVAHQLGAAPRRARTRASSHAAAASRVARRARAAISSRSAADLGRQLARARRALAEPERDRRRRAVRRPRRAPRPASTRRMRHEVLPSRKTSPAMLSIAKSSSTRADERAVGLQHDVVVGVVGDRAARGERGQARAAPAAQRAGRRRRGGAARRARPRLVAMPSDEHVDDRVEVARARESRVRARRGGRARRARPRPTPRHAQAATICCARMSSGASRSAMRVELAARGRRAPAPRTRPARRASAGRAAPWACAPQRVAGAADALQARSRSSAASRPGRRRSTAPTSMPSSSDAVATTTRSSPALSRCSASSRRSRDRLPWCAATTLLAEPLAEVVRHALDQAARVDEHQRRPVLARQRRRRGRRSRPTARWCTPRRARRSGTSIARSSVAPLPDVDDRRQRGRVDPTQQPRRDLDRPHRRREADPLRPRAAGRGHQRVEPLERERQVRAALVAGHGVDLVDDDRRARSRSARRARLRR